MFSRAKAIGGLSADGKLKNRCSLTAGEQSQQDLPPIRKFECIVVLIGNVQVNGAKSRYAEPGALSPYPTVIKLNIFVKSQFGSGKEADGHLQIVLGGKAACGRMPKARRDQFIGDLGGSRLDGVQAIVTHGMLPSRGSAPHRDWPERQPVGRETKSQSAKFRTFRQ
jgi:hypothetical protein